VPLSGTGGRRLPSHRVPTNRILRRQYRPQAMAPGPPAAILYSGAHTFPAAAAILSSIHLTPKRCSTKMGKVDIVCRQFVPVSGANGIFRLATMEMSATKRLR